MSETIIITFGKWVCGPGHCVHLFIFAIRKYLQNNYLMWHTLDSDYMK